MVLGVLVVERVINKGFAALAFIVEIHFIF